MLVIYYYILLIMSASNDFIKELITDETPVRILIETQKYNEILIAKGREFAEGIRAVEGADLVTLVESDSKSWTMYDSLEAAKDEIAE